MKRRLFMFSIILLFGIMLLFPTDVLSGASSGLLLWFQVVLPTLLPFMIVCNLLIGTHAITFIARITEPLLSRIFCVSSNGSFIVLVGFLCGYPMGAKITADLIHKNAISTKEGQYLLSFCNNTSPMFILSFVVLQNLRNKDFLLPTMMILFFSPILLSFVFRRFYHINKHTYIATSYSEFKPFSARIIDDSIMNAFEAIVKVGGYIMIFSIFLSLAQRLPLHSFTFTSLLLPSLEITNGIQLLCTTTQASHASFILTLALTSFGGWCAIAQTHCMVSNTGLSLWHYITEKLITAMVTSLFAYIFIIL